MEEGTFGSEGVRGAVVYGGRTIGWMEGFRQSGRHAGALPKLPGNTAMLRETKKGKGSSHHGSGDLAIFPFLCLSGFRLQHQRKSRNVQAQWWMRTSSTSAPKNNTILKKQDERENYFQSISDIDGKRALSADQTIVLFVTKYQTGTIGFDHVSKTMCKLTTQFESNATWRLKF